MPEIGLPDARREDEVVIAELDLLTQRAPGQHLPRCVFQAGHLGYLEIEIVQILDQVTQRVGDLALGQMPVAHW